MLLLGVNEEFLKTLLPTYSRLLVSSEWSPQKVFSHFINPDKSCFHPIRRTVSSLQPVRPYGACQAIVDGVNVPKHFFLTRPRQNADHGTEYFLFCNPHALLYINEHGGFNEEPARQFRVCGSIPSSKKARAVVNSRTNEAKHFSMLRLTAD